LNIAAWRRIDESRFGVIGGILACTCANGTGLAALLLTVWPLDPPTNKAAGIGVSSSSGSTSSNNLSAALSACSALALSASSTTGCPGTPSGSDPDDIAFDTVAVG